MKKFIAIVLVMLTCCFTIGFFTGCDSEKKYIVIVGPNYLDQAKGTDYWENQDKLNEALKGFTITMYESKKAYDYAIKHMQTPVALTITYIDPAAPTKEETYKDETGKDKTRTVPNYQEATTLDLYTVKYNGGYVNLSINNPGTRKFRVRFQGGSSDDFEYTVGAAS